MVDMRIQNMKVGEKFSTTPRVVTATDIETFCTLSGMVHPVFMSDSYVRSDTCSQAIGLTGRVAPGQLLLSIMMGSLMDSGILNDVVVQLGINNVKFTTPCYPYDMGHAEIEITGNRETKSGDRIIVDYKWQLVKQDGNPVVVGENTCMFKKT
ncbi:MAG: MaoC family dehydratase N-terminal domain-containing protein [Dehalococcoidia bacterium]|jgi:acyl dehydratase|nr:MaoC family dehydratase N-terminal domain-containing protein [Dehalococcoidia bacterium]